jgi:hypothetical protein
MDPLTESLSHADDGLGYLGAIILFVIVFFYLLAKGFFNVKRK